MLRNIIKVTSVFFILLFLFASDSFSQTGDSGDSQKAKAVALTPYLFPTAKQRFRRYLNDSVGIGAIAGTVIGATFSHIDNQPPEWKKNGSGFARRLASNFGENAIEQASLYGLSEVFRQDQEYRKCDCTKVPNRIGHALRSGFTARNRSGNLVFSPPKVVSPFVANVAAVKLWYPDRFTVQDGVRRGAYGVAFNAAFNLIEEFIFKKK
jgi:hypothetical protein